MFFACLNLKSLDLNNINTINVKNMTGMFYLCNSLEKLEISNLDTSNVITM